VTVFDRTIAVNPDADDADRASIELPATWASMRGVHGGFLAAVAVQAVGARLDGRRVRTLTSTFLRPSAIGPASLTIHTLRAGRSLATFEVTITQDHKPVMVTRLTATAPVVSADWDHGPRPLVPPPGDCISVPPPWPIAHLDHGVAILDPRHLPLSRGERAVLAGHVRPVEDRPIDEAWLAMVLDFFPPSTWTRIDPPSGVLSVDYTVHVHRTITEPLAADQWLAVRFETEVASDGLALEHGTVAGPDGRLLAESFHTRWMAS
jgi:acyl-CoA thioesterase